MKMVFDLNFKEKSTMNFLRQIIAAFVPENESPEEIAYHSKCKLRPVLNHEEFYAEFYSNTDVSFDTCSRVLKVLRVQLNLINLRPDDNVALIFSDMDFSDICLEIGDEFRVKFSENTWAKMNGTVGSLIRTTESLTKSESVTASNLNHQ